VIDYLDPVRIAERAIAAARYHAALTAALPLAGARALADGPTAGELLLESEYGRDLRPQLSRLYSAPITAGLAGWQGMSRAEIARWVLDYYQEQETAASLNATFRRYGRRGFNLGGQMALAELGLLGAFDLTDEAILTRLDDHAAALVDSRAGAELSVAVTTAEEIGREVEQRQEDGATAVEMLPLLSAWVLGRTVIRSTVIATTENVRATRWGLLYAFAGNGIRGVRHLCESDVDDRCGGRICPPLCGTEYELPGVFDPMSGIPAAGHIPLHPRCRCAWEPLRDGWLKPALIWTGFAIGLLAGGDETQE
jgi:hypothetical protein